MRKRYFLVLVTMWLLFASGCATEAKFRNMLTSYENHSIRTAIKDWGVPSGKYVDGDRTYYTWLKSRNSSVPVYTPSYQTSHHSGNAGPYSYSGTSTSYGGSYQNVPVHEWCEVTLVTDSSTNRIIDWSYRGNACVSRYDGP